MPTTISIPLTLLLCLLSTATATATHHRHLLHQPFFPVTATAAPPAQPPAVSPQPHPQTHQPKYPFTSTTPITPRKPFFPNFPSPPPPPPHTLATFPANISSVLFPHPPSSSSPFTGRHLIISLAISLPLLLAAALFAFLIYSRRQDTPSRKTENSRLFPPNTVSSESPQPPPKISPRPGVSCTSSSEFLYLGTLANPHTPDYQPMLSALSHNIGVTAGVSPFAATSSTTTTSPYQKLGSPELRPLPPLPKLNYTPTYRSGEVLLGPNSKRHDTEEDDEEDGDEEFYSPRGSSGRKDPLGSPAPVQVVVVGRSGSSSRNDIRVQGNNFYGSDGSFNSRTASYPLPNAGFPPTNNNSVVTTPSHASKLSHKGVDFEDNSPETIISFAAPAKRSSLPSVSYSSSSLSSPASSLSSPRGRGTGTSWNLGNSPSPDRVLGFQRRDGAFLVNQTVPPVRLPPPPPPPPPPRFWEVPIRPTDLASSERPAVVTPSNPVTFQSEVSLPDRDHVQGNLGLDRNEEISKPKLKPLHWDKVRARSDRAMVWDRIKSSSFQLNEEMIETLFTVNNPNLVPKDCNERRQSLPLAYENRVLDPRKSQNIAILLRALNVTIEEVCEALVEGNSDTLGTELLESLTKMAPSEEEERKLKEFKDESPVKLGPAEKFLKAVIEIPFAFKRIDAMIYIANFDSETEYLRRSFDTLEAACGELKNSRMFFKLLEAVLKTGNRMNVGTNRGDARAFKLDTLLKLVDVKGTDGKTSLLHFVVQEIIRSEGSRLCDSTETMTPEPSQQSDLQDDVRYRKLGLQVVSGLSGELSNVKKAAAMDSDVLSGEVLKLSGGVTKVREVLKLNEEIALKETSRKFSESMMGFLNQATEDIMKIQAQEEVALTLVQEITEYFHGNSAKEEAHPFRIFMVVRDFLSVLDRVCKEVGKINERTICSTVRPLLVSMEPSPVFPQFHAHQHCSSDDESP